ncbi:ribosome silencing factor [Magnetococcales bacterium HHB-1]
MDSLTLVDALTEHLDSKKAFNLCTLDLRERGSIADFFVLATGNSSPHVSFLAEEVDRFAHENRLEVFGVEGLTLGEWVLVDLGDVVVHIFQRETRELYNLEKLWKASSLKADEAHQVAV